MYSFIFLVYRDLFVDNETKQILKDVDNVKLNCSIAGISPLLSFAYSGNLKISEEALIPTYFASKETKLKEVKNNIILGFLQEVKIQNFPWIQEGTF